MTFEIYPKNGRKSAGPLVNEDDLTIEVIHKIFSTGDYKSALDGACVHVTEGIPYPVDVRVSNERAVIEFRAEAVLTKTHDIDEVLDFISQMNRLPTLCLLYIEIDDDDGRMLVGKSQLNLLSGVLMDQIYSHIIFFSYAFQGRYLAEGASSFISYGENVVSVDFKRGY